MPATASVNPSSAPKRLLCMDGGGIRGIIEAEVLMEMESQLKQLSGGDRPLCEHFDLIGGTSTGFHSQISRNSILAQVSQQAAGKKNWASRCQGTSEYAKPCGSFRRPGNVAVGVGWRLVRAVGKFDHCFCLGVAT